MVGVYRWKTEGQSEGDLPRDPTLPWLRPRTLLGLPRDPSRLGVAFTCRAMPYQAATRVMFCVPSQSTGHFTLGLSSAFEDRIAAIGLTRRSPRFFPFARPSFSISTISLFRFHSVFLHSLYFSLSLSSPSSLRRTSPFPSRAGTPGFLHLARSIPANEAWKHASTWSCTVCTST